MTGEEMKAFIKSQGVNLWQVGAALGMNDGNFSRRLRKPFNDAEADKIKAIIKELSTNSEKN